MSARIRIEHVPGWSSVDHLGPHMAARANDLAAKLAPDTLARARRLGERICRTVEQEYASGYGPRSWPKLSVSVSE